tara:strand:+ start:224 stop:445 length:222 start_codon:yes stop_codon:yes gene_type:complete
MKPNKNPLIDKLLALKYRINDAYNNKTKADSETRADKTYVMTLISDIRHNSIKFTKLCKEDFEKCNGLWRTYE